MRFDRERLSRHKNYIALGFVGLALAFLGNIYTPPSAQIPKEYVPEIALTPQRRLFNGTAVEFPSAPEHYLNLTEPQKDFLTGMLSRGLMLLYHARVIPQRSDVVVRVLVSSVETPVEEETYADAASYLEATPQPYCLIRFSGAIFPESFTDPAGNGPIPPTERELLSLGDDWVSAHELHHCPGEAGHAQVHGSRFEGESDAIRALGVYDLNNVYMPQWHTDGLHKPYPLRRQQAGSVLPTALALLHAYNVVYALERNRAGKPL